MIVEFNEYPIEVQHYMKDVVKCLQADYGDIPKSWMVSLKLIADNYQIYLEAKRDIDANGIIRTDNQGRDFKNQAVSVMNVAQRNIVDLLKQFSLTPMSKSKMKNLDKGDLQKSPLDDFLSDDF